MLKIYTFTFMHLADAFIQSDLQLHSGYTFSLVCVFPENRTHILIYVVIVFLSMSNKHTIIFAPSMCHDFDGLD